MASKLIPKVVFSDIDGTLLNPERELSEYTIREVKRIKDHIPMVLISSRMPSGIYHLQRQLNILDQPIICYNGGLILSGNTVLSSTVIPIEIISSLADFNQNQEFHISLYHNDEWYVPEMDFWAKREMNNTKVKPQVKNNRDVITDWNAREKGAHKIMCMGSEDRIDKAHQFLTDNFENKLHCYRSKSTYLEIAHASISKETAVNQLLDQHFDFPIHRALAFGDNYNDIAMLKAVGTGVAVANAKPETLEIADFITLAGKEDGVARYIEKNIIL